MVIRVSFDLRDVLNICRVVFCSRAVPDRRCPPCLVRRYRVRGVSSIKRATFEQKMSALGTLAESDARKCERTSSEQQESTQHEQAIRSTLSVAGGGWRVWGVEAPVDASVWRTPGGFANRGFELSPFPETREHTLGP